MLLRTSLYSYDIRTGNTRNRASQQVRTMIYIILRVTLRNL